MLNTIKKDAVEGVKVGISIYAAEKIVRVADNFAAKFVGPSIPAYIRTPVVGLAFALVARKLVGSKLAGLATAVAFKEVIASVADPMVNGTLASVGLSAAPAGLLPASTTAAAVNGYASGTTGGYMRGMGALERRGTRGYAVVGQ